VLEWRRPGGTDSAEMSQGWCADLSTPSRYGDVKPRREATARLRIREVKETRQDVARRKGVNSPEGSEPVLSDEDAYPDVDVGAWCW
jgi:hypothetical protein